MKKQKNDYKAPSMLVCEMQSEAPLATSLPVVTTYSDTTMEALTKEQDDETLKTTTIWDDVWE